MKRRITPILFMAMMFMFSSGLVQAASGYESFSFYVEAKGGSGNSGHFEKEKKGNADVNVKRISSSCSPNLQFSMRIRETNTNEIATGYKEFDKNFTGSMYLKYVSGMGKLEKVYYLRIRTPYASPQAAWAEGNLRV